MNRFKKKKEHVVEQLNSFQPTVQPAQTLQMNLLLLTPAHKAVPLSSKRMKKKRFHHQVKHNLRIFSELPLCPNSPIWVKLITVIISKEASRIFRRYLTCSVIWRWRCGNARALRFNVIINILLIRLESQIENKKQGDLIKGVKDSI